MRLVRAGLALLALLTLLALVPAVLIAVAGWPLPEDLPDHVEARRWRTDPISDAAVIGAAACVGWLLWAWAVYTVVVAALTRLSRVRLPRVRLPRPRTGGALHTAAGGMIGAIAVGLSTATTASAAPVGLAAATAPTAPDGPSSDDVGTAPPGPPDRAQPVRHHDAGGEPGDASGAGGDAGDGDDGELDRWGVAAAGVRLPDGSWLSAPLAAALGSTATLLWLHQRRTYHPRPPTPGGGRGGSAVPAGVPTAARRVPAPPPGGTAGAAVVPAGGVGLVGAGADDTARALLAGYLLPTTPAVRVLITAAHWRRLLAAAPPPAAVQIVPDLPAALHTVEEHLHTCATADLTARHTTRAQGGAQDEAEGGAGGGAKVPAPAGLVLFAAAPPPALATRLAVALSLGARHRVTAVLTGGWPDGTTWTTHPHPPTRPGPGPPPHSPSASVPVDRLSLPAAADIIDLLHRVEAAAAPNPGPPPTALPLTATPGPPPTAVHPPPSASPHTPATARTSATARTASTPHSPAGSSRRRVAVYMLGRDLPRVVVLPGGQEVSFERRAAVQLLTLLVVHRDGATRDAILDTLWPDVRMQAATRRLATTMSSLRTTLRTACGSEVVPRHADSYRLRADLAEVDVWRLCDAAGYAATSTDPAERHRQLHRVVDLYTGDLAGPPDWTWLTAYRETARRHTLDACTTLAAASTDPDEATALLNRATAADPLNEDVHRRLMRQHATAGDLDAVAATLHTLRQRLTTAGMRPDPATLTLAALLLQPAPSTRRSHR